MTAWKLRKIPCHFGLQVQQRIHLHNPGTQICTGFLRFTLRTLHQSHPGWSQTIPSLQPSPCAAQCINSIPWEHGPAAILGFFGTQSPLDPWNNQQNLSYHVCCTQDVVVCKNFLKFLPAETWIVFLYLVSINQCQIFNINILLY